MCQGVVDELQRQLEQCRACLRERDSELAEARRQLATMRCTQEQFVAAIAHDLRAPLNAVLGYARLLARRVGAELDERQRRNLDNIAASADELLRRLESLTSRRADAAAAGEGCQPAAGPGGGACPGPRDGSARGGGAPPPPAGKEDSQP